MSVVNLKWCYVYSETETKSVLLSCREVIRRIVLLIRRHCSGSVQSNRATSFPSTNQENDKMAAATLNYLPNWRHLFFANKSLFLQIVMQEKCLYFSLGFHLVRVSYSVSYSLVVIFSLSWSPVSRLTLNKLLFNLEHQASSCLSRPTTGWITSVNLLSLVPRIHAFRQFANLINFLHESEQIFKWPE